MRQVILHKLDVDTVLLDDIVDCEPIFAKKNGKFFGMVVEEDRGWVLRIGGKIQSGGFYKTSEQCIKFNSMQGYTFYVELNDGM